MYVPNTVLEGDIRGYVTDLRTIVATFKKSVGDPRYTEIVRSGKKVDWSRIRFPDEYAYLMELIKYRIGQ